MSALSSTPFFIDSKVFSVACPMAPLWPQTTNLFEEQFKNNRANNTVSIDRVNFIIFV